LRLLEAAVECLAELGWAGSTVAVVAERAGVSRGAAQHHFPTREELFSAAFAYMVQARLEALRQAAEGLPAAGPSPAGSPSPARTEAVLTLLAGLYTGSLFRAALHLHTAAAAATTSDDHAMATAVAQDEARVNAEVHRVAVQLLGVDESVPGHRELVQGSLDLIRGLALADVLTDDSGRRRKVLRRWAAVLDQSLHPDPHRDPHRDPHPDAHPDVL
jgi:AcrR family transcriptional regulator